MTYTPPEGFVLDPPSGRYYRQDGIVNGKQWVTWFDAASGEYEQVQYPAQPQPAPTAPLVARGNASPPPASTAVPQKRGKGILVAVIALVVLVAAVFGGHFLGLYSLPFLTDSVNAVSVLETQGTVDIARSSDTLTARAGMRLENLDTVQTGQGSSAWLSLDDDKAVGLSELTALRIDQGRRGFALTLVKGEIRAQIDKPLADNEDFTVKAGNLALAVRGTVFTANYAGGIVSVHVESGVVAVLDAQGNEIAELGAGESGEYEAGEGDTPSSESEQTGNDSTPSDRPDFPADGYGVWEYGNYRYEGEWRNGKPNGYGVYSYSWSDDGRTYDERLEAEWVDGLPNWEAKLSEHGVDHERSMEWDYVWSGNMVDGYFHGRMVEEYLLYPDDNGDGFSGTAVFEADMGTITVVISNDNPSYLSGSIGDDYYIGNVAGNFVANGHSFPWLR